MKKVNDDDLTDAIRNLPKHHLTSESRQKILTAIRQEYDRDIYQSSPSRQRPVQKKRRFISFKGPLVTGVTILLIAGLGWASWNQFIKQGKVPSGTSTKMTQPAKQHPPTSKTPYQKFEQPPGKTIQLSSLKQPINGLKMVDPKSGWFQSGNQILHSVDGGKTWQDVTPKDVPTTNELGQSGIKAAFYDAKHASLAIISMKNNRYQETTIYTTSDGGRTWKTSTLPTAKFSSDTDGVLSFYFTSVNEGWLLLSEGTAMHSQVVTLYHTSDQGKTWSIKSESDPQGSSNNVIPYSGSQKAISSYQRAFWLSGMTLYDKLYLYKSSDSGQSWQEQTLPVAKGYSAAGGASTTYPPKFFNQNEGIMPVQFRSPNIAFDFYVTQDGGQTWKPGTAVSTQSVDYQIIDDHHIAVLDTTVNTLYISNDQGQSWKTVKMDRALDGFDFISPTVGYGYKGDILFKTTDGGATWIPLAK